MSTKLLNKLLLSKLAYIQRFFGFITSYSGFQSAALEAKRNISIPGNIYNSAFRSTVLQHLNVRNILDYDGDKI